MREMASAPALGDDDEKQFLKEIYNRLPADSRKVVDRLAAVKSKYVESKRDIILEKLLNKFVGFLLAERNKRRDDGRILFITGESGAGKSSAVQRMLSRHPALQPMARSYGVINPVVSISLSGHVTQRLLGEQIMAAARGYKTTKRMERGEVWDNLPAELRLRKVLIIHIDEPQQLLEDTNFNREDLAKALKGVMNSPEWPVSFILSGLPNTDTIATMDEQFERRGKFIRLPDIRMPKSRPVVEKIIRELAEAGSIRCDGVVSNDIPERVAHAANYRYGRITQVVVAALHVALDENADELTYKHFATAYIEHSHAKENDTMNPFLVADWRRLKPGSFLFKKDARG